MNCCRCKTKMKNLPYVYLCLTCGCIYNKEAYAAFRKQAKEIYENRKNKGGKNEINNK